MAPRLVWTAVALLLLAVVTMGATPQRAEYAIVVVLDQFVPYYLEVYDLPNLKELMKNGVFFPEAWVGDLASVTIVSHAVIHTGRFPKAFCIVDYGWRDPNNVTRVINPGDLQFILAGGIRKIMESSGVKSISYYIKQYWPDAKTAGGSAKAYIAPGFEPYMDIMFIALPKKINGTDYYIPGYKVPSYLNNSRFWLPKSELYNKADEWVMNVSIEILRRERPRFMLINLPLIDVWGHRTGAQAALEQMEFWVKNADRQLGRLIDELKALGIYNKTLLVVISDHGATPGYWKYTPDLFVQLLSAAGIKAVRVTGGTYAAIWLENMDNAKKAAEVLASAKLPRVKAIYYKTKTKFGYRYVPIIDAYLTTDPIYEKLLDTAACFSGPDVAVIFDEYTILGTIEAQHGGPQWSTQNILMVISGPGLPKGVVYHTSLYAGPRLVDIAPTILYLMGIPGEGGVVGRYEMDGRVLLQELGLADKSTDGQTATGTTVLQPPTQGPPGPQGPQGPPGPPGPPGESAPTWPLWLAILMSLAAVALAIYSLTRRK